MRLRFPFTAIYNYFLYLSGCLLLTVSLPSECKAQDTARIYHFMNEELPPLEFAKSNWGVFFSAYPYFVDTAFCSYLEKDRWPGVPETVLEDFQNQRKAMAPDTGWQKRFRWEPLRLHHFIVTKSTKQVLPQAAAANIQGTSAIRKEAIRWIKEWNRSPGDERLFNYSSIPLFSSDGMYVLLLRGQHMTGQGWDTIYVYKRTDQGFEVAGQVIVSTI